MLARMALYTQRLTGFEPVFPFASMATPVLTKLDACFYGAEGKLRWISTNRKQRRAAALPKV